MSKSKVACPKKPWSQRAVPVLTSVFLTTGFCAAVQAAPDIEQAPRLTNEDYGAELYPNSHAIAVPVGEAGFYPSGAVRISSVDNLFYQSTDEKSATQLRVIPKLDLVAEGSKSVFWGIFRGDLKRNNGDSGVEKADTADYRLRGFSHIDLDNRNRLDLELSHSRLSEELGTGRTATLVSDDNSNNVNPDTYNLNRLGLTYSYGNPRSRGELVAGVSVGSIEYVENEEELEKFDRDMSLLWGRFSYKLTGKTRLFSQLTYRDYEYKKDDSRDRETTSITFGANWDSTGLWYGNAYVTLSDWEYGNRAAEANSGSDTTWETNLYWAIRSYSNANFYIRQFIDDATNGDAVATTKTSTVGVRWKHGWSERFNTTVATYSSYDELDDTKTNERQVISLEGRLSIRRWLNFLVGSSVDSLDSGETDAKRQFVYIGLEGNL